MFDGASLTVAEEDAYGLIEAAVMESARGRRFLAEYARRNRSADTDMLLAAIGRLEGAVARDRGDDVGRFRGDLMEMADSIARTRAEISAISAPDQDHTRLTVASEALDAIVRATERATSDILGAAEDVQEAAWTLREAGTAPEICDELDRRATQIYTACSFQDLTAQRTSRIVHTLRYLEDRIASMIAIWGQRLDAVPPPVPGERPHAAAQAAPDLCQSDVDRFLETEPEPGPQQSARAPLETAVPLDHDVAFLADDGLPAETVWPEPTPAAEPAAEPEETVAADDLGLAFGDLDRLSIEEKIALFS